MPSLALRIKECCGFGPQLNFLKSLHSTHFLRRDYQWDCSLQPETTKSRFSFIYTAKKKKVLCAKSVLTAIAEDSSD